MEPEPAGSRLFHTIVVVGLSVAATACGSTDRTASRADGAAPLPDGSSDDAAADDALQASGETGSLPPDSAHDAGDASAAGEGSIPCNQVCCPPGGGQITVPCGSTCLGTWPCYV